MYTSHPHGDREPGHFETFKVHIVTAPDHDGFECFNIPADLMEKAGKEAGLSNVLWQLQYPDPEFAENEVIRKYMVDCKMPDYLMKLQF